MLKIEFSSHCKNVKNKHCTAKSCVSFLVHYTSRGCVLIGEVTVTWHILQYAKPLAIG